MALILDNKIYGVEFNLNMGIKICNNSFGLVAAQLIFEAQSRMMNGFTWNPLYKHT